MTQNKTHSGFAPYLILSLGVLVGVSVAWSEVHRPLSDEEYRELQAKVLRGGATIDEVKKLDLESRYRPMRSVKRFTAPGLSTRGTADAIGLKHDSLAFHLEKRFLDNFSFLQKDFSLEAIDDLDEQKEVGWFTCDIMTAGDDNPVAYHIECSGSTLEHRYQWKEDTLGFGHKSVIEQRIKEGLDEFVEAFAMFVLKSKGKM